MYILIVKYENDAERKRIDYAVERWEKRISMEKLRGVVILIKGNEGDLSAFVEDLFSRVENPRNKVSVYRVEILEPDVEKKNRVLEYEVSDVKSMKKFIDYLMAKIGACLSYRDGECKVYNVQTKKGLVKLEVCFRDKRIFFRFEGYGRGVDHLVARVDEEVRMFLD